MSEDTTISCPHAQSKEKCSRCSLNKTFGINETNSNSDDIDSTNKGETNINIESDVNLDVSIPPDDTMISEHNTIGPSVANVSIPLDSEVVEEEDHDANISEEIKENDEAKVDKEKETVVTKPLIEPPSWTLRLISSDRLDAALAVEYLHIIHEKPLLTFLGKRLFDLNNKDVDFFLPQLMYLYVHKIDVASVSHAYIEQRHQNNPQFSIMCSWLLDCFIAAVSQSVTPNHALMLRGMMRNESSQRTTKNLSNKENPVISTLSLETLKETDWIGNKPRRSVKSVEVDEADEIGIEAAAVDQDLNEKTIKLSRELTTKELMNNEQKFTDRLIKVGKKLMMLHLASATKAEKMTALRHELQLINDALPASVWIPFDDQHLVLNICYNESSVLNSKDKVPYVLFAEVLRSSPRYSLDVPQKRYIYDKGEKINNQKNKLEIMRDFSDPSAAVFAETWSDKRERIRVSSDYGGHEQWDVVPLIVKFGDDLSQEAFAQQLLQIFKDIWHEEGVPLYLRPYKIVCAGPDAGFIEPVLDTLSLHQIKRHLTTIFRQKGDPATPTLKHHFENMFGSPSTEDYVNAQKNFIQSTAAYSLVSYYLQLKDRHNGNILLDLDGHLIHIDYGFLLSSSPRNLGFETAPFKLTNEIVEVMGGIDSDMFLYYKSLLLRGLMAARKHYRRIVSLAEIMSVGSKMQCFRAGPETVRALELRFHVSSTDEQLQQLVDTLVNGSRDNYTTRFYDSFQYYTNGIH